MKPNTTHSTEQNMTKQERKIEIDISGQIQQKNLDSALGFRRNDGLRGSVFLKKELKKKINQKYKSQITNLVEKLHCILIYYCIKDHLEGIENIRICKDVNARKIGYLLPFLFKDNEHFSKAKLSFIQGEKCNGHAPALKSFRHRKWADKIITMEMIENVLFKFK